MIIYLWPEGINRRHLLLIGLESKTFLKSRGTNLSKSEPFTRLNQIDSKLSGQLYDGWFWCSCRRYYFSLFLEFSDITMPFARGIFTKIRVAVFFFLVCMIGSHSGRFLPGQGNPCAGGKMSLFQFPYLSLFFHIIPPPPPKLREKWWVTFGSYFNPRGLHREHLPRINFHRIKATSLFPSQ